MSWERDNKINTSENIIVNVKHVQRNKGSKWLDREKNGYKT